MRFLTVPLIVPLALVLAACGESGGDSNGNVDAGSSGTSNGGSSGGQGGSSGEQTSTGGTAGQAGNLGDAGQAGGGASGTTNDGGTSGEAGATGGNGGEESDSGTPAEPPWQCPEGPFPQPEVGESETLCADFNFAFNYLEGPTWVKADNALYFANFNIGTASPGDIIKYTLGGQCEVFTTNVGCNGLAVGLDGTLIGACQQSRSVESFDLTTKAATTLASMYMGQMLDSPNDLIVHSNGSVYFTNRTAELGGRPVDYGSAIFWIDPAGTLNLIENGDGNGIALSPDERTLYVNNKGSWALDENGVPGAKGPQIVNGDGLAVDCAGNLYMSGGQIVNAQGQNIGNFPGGTNMAFGGPDGTTLFVVSGGGNVRALHMNVPGLP